MNEFDPCDICQETDHETAHCPEPFCAHCHESISNCLGTDADDPHDSDEHTVSAEDLYGTPEHRAFLERHGMGTHGIV